MMDVFDRVLSTVGGVAAVMLFSEYAHMDWQLTLQSMRDATLGAMWTPEIHFEQSPWFASAMR